jgi:hypothetical protein
MADAVSGVPTPPAVPGTAITTPPADSPAKPEYATKEEFSAVLSRLEGISGKLSVIERAAKQAAPPIEKPPADESLTGRVKGIEEREARQRERERLSAIKSALNEGGVQGKNAERAAKLILIDHGPKIQVGEDFSVTYRENEDKATPISEWIKAYLSTDDGKFFLPGKALPGGVQGGTNGSAAQAVEHPFLKLTYSEIMKSPRMDLRSSFFKAHPEKAQEKLRAYQETGK